MAYKGFCHIKYNVILGTNCSISPLGQGLNCHSTSEGEAVIIKLTEVYPPNV